MKFWTVKSAEGRSSGARVPGAAKAARRVAAYMRGEIRRVEPLRASSQRKP